MEIRFSLWIKWIVGHNGYCEWNQCINGIVKKQIGSEMWSFDVGEVVNNNELLG